MFDQLSEEMMMKSLLLYKTEYAHAAMVPKLFALKPLCPSGEEKPMRTLNMEPDWSYIVHGKASLWYQLEKEGTYICLQEG